MGLAEALVNKGHDIEVPWAFVTPIGGEDLNVIYGTTDPSQDLRQRFSVVVCVNNRINRGDDSGVAELEANNTIVLIQEQLEKAFFGWRPIQKFDFVRFARDRSLSFDNVRLWHEFEWTISYTETPAPTEEENEVDKVINGVDDDDWEAGDNYLPSMSTVLNKIFTTYNVFPPPADPGNTLNDGYPRAIAHPNASANGASLEDIEEHREQGEPPITMLPVVPRKSASEIGEKVTHSPLDGPDDFMHGEPVNEL